MLVLNGTFKDNTFVPDSVVPLPDGTRVTVSVAIYPKTAYI